MVGNNVFSSIIWVSRFRKLDAFLLIAVLLYGCGCPSCIRHCVLSLDFVSDRQFYMLLLVGVLLRVKLLVAWARSGRYIDDWLNGELTTGMCNSVLLNAGCICRWLRLLRITDALYRWAASMTDKLESDKMVTDAFLSWLIVCFVDSASESVVLLAFII